MVVANTATVATATVLSVYNVVVASVAVVIDTFVDATTVVVSVVGGAVAGVLPVLSHLSAVSLE